MFVPVYALLLLVKGVTAVLSNTLHSQGFFCYFNFSYSGGHVVAYHFKFFSFFWFLVVLSTLNQSLMGISEVDLINHSEQLTEDKEEKI